MVFFINFYLFLFKNLDAVAIVLASTALEMSNPLVADLGSFETLVFLIKNIILIKFFSVQYAFKRFLEMFFVSAALGSAVGFISALVNLILNNK